MNEWVEIERIPDAQETYMIAGWHQWADAGSISSGLPRYLINHIDAQKIGDIRPDSFYLFQIPGTHHLLRPKIELEDGYPKSLETKKNEFYYWSQEEKGLVIFVGEEPHQNEDVYAEAFFDAVDELRVRRVVAVGGVYGAMPYDKERDISCVYSLPEMRADLADYAVRFSNYQGGSTIGTYLAHMAEEREIEFLVLYAFVPAYDFQQLSILLSGMRIENDFKAWYDLMRRLNHMFGIHIDLSDLEQKSEELTMSMGIQLEELDKKAPQLKLREHLRKLTEDFEERPFMPLDDVWEQELRDLFDDEERT